MSEGESQSQNQSRGPAGTRAERGALAGVLALIAVVHLPLLGFRFVYDDWWTFVANGFLRSPGDLGLLLGPEAVARHIPDAFRPTLVVFDTLCYWLLGVNPAPQHGVSIALHVLVCWLLARWLRALGASLELRLTTVAVFGLLAVHAEAVAVVSFHEDLLAAALGLGALVLLTPQARDADRPASLRRHGLAALLMAAACGAKMSAAPLPALWALALWLDPWGSPERRRTGLGFGVLALGVGVALAVVHTAVLHGGVSPYGELNPRLMASRIGLGPVLARSVQIHLQYLQQIVAPFGLSPEYTDGGARWGDPETVLAGAALLSLLLYGLSCALPIGPGRRPRRPIAALAILGALLLCIPTSNLVAIPNMQAERFVYLTSAPICIGLAVVLLAIGTRLVPAATEGTKSAEAGAAIQPLQLAAPVLFCVVQGGLLQAHAQHYKSNQHLWTAGLAGAPDSARAHALHAETLLSVARTASARGEQAHERLLLTAEGHCRIAVSLDPLYELPQICFARLAIERRQWERAHRRLTRALSVSPDRNDRILASLAQISHDRPSVPAAERAGLAAEYIARGVREYPYSPDLRAAAGRIAHLSGDPDAAREHYRVARELAPERLQTSVWELELALDTGDGRLARQIWVRDRKLLGKASDPRRASLLLRLREVERLFPSTPQASILPNGVAPDEP